MHDRLDVRPGGERKNVCSPDAHPDARLDARKASPGHSTGDRLDDLPGSVREIAEVIGRQATLHLLGQLPVCVAGKPGKQSSRVMLYVPKKIGPKHHLVQILGAEKAMALVRAFGGETMQPANCRKIYAAHRDEAILKMLRDGARLSMVQSIMRVSKRHIVNLARSQRGAG